EVCDQQVTFSRLQVLQHFHSRVERAFHHQPFYLLEQAPDTIQYNCVIIHKHYPCQHSASRFEEAKNTSVLHITQINAASGVSAISAGGYFKGPPYVAFPPFKRRDQPVDG